MFGRFGSNHNRYTSLDVVPSLPSGSIDSVWLIIDLNLKRVIPLSNLFHFDLLNNNGKMAVRFSQENSSIEMAIDLPLSYSTAHPSRIFVFDDSYREVVLLPAEMLES